MSNDHYLIVSYFVGLGLALGLAALTYRVLREPFGRIADAALTNSKSIFLKRALPVTLTVAATLAFLGVSYTDNSCGSYTYQQVVSERSYLEQQNRRQLAETSITMAQVVVGFSLAALICLIVVKRNDEQKKD